MREVANLAQLETCSKVFLTLTEKPKALYLCWQEATRLACAKVDTDVEAPQYFKFTAVSQVKPLSKYLFAASNNLIFFWAPENPQCAPSVFIELSKDARILSFTFHNGRFLLLWTIDFQRKVFVTLTNKKAQVLAQRELSTLAVYRLDFLDLPEEPFHIEAGDGKVWTSLSDGSLWAASLNDDSLAEFAKVANLHSPAVWISQAAGVLRCICCLGRFYAVSADLETIQDRSCVAPVLQVFQFEECVLAVTPSKCSFVKFDADGSCDVQQSQWRDLLSVSASHRGNSKELVCVFRSGKICFCSGTEFFHVSPEENSTDNCDPWEKLQNLADLRESRAMTHLSALDSVQKQLALLMYLKFQALSVQCNVVQNCYPTLFEDRIVTCELLSEEQFDPSMWVVSVLLKPHGKDVALIKSVPFQHKGTSVSVQLESPRSLLLNVRLFLSLRSRLIPRTLSLMIHEQDLFSLPGQCETPSPGFLLHQPSVECCVAKELQSLIGSIVGGNDVCSVVGIGNTKLARVTLRNASMKQSLSLRAVLIKLLLRKTFTLQPKILVPERMEQMVKTSREQLQACRTMREMLEIYEQWRSFTMTLPLL